VVIKDFNFAPTPITIQVGDTVTWVNQGPSNHTATGEGFDTGILRSGTSASHLFTRAGTFSYFCSVHPFMRAQIVVLASSSSSGGGSSSSGGGSSSSTSPSSPPSASESASTAATPTNEPRGPRLPFTGTNLLAQSLAGLGMLVVGLALALLTRRRRAPAPQASRRERTR
jgi:Copper binding proteins, plastocyanin/azurin family